MKERSLQKSIGKLLLAVVIPCCAGSAYAVRDPGYTEADVIPFTRLSENAAAKIRTTPTDPVRVSAEVEATTPGTLAVLYSAVPNRPGTKVLNVAVTLRSSTTERPNEQGAVSQSYGMDSPTAEAIEGRLSDSKFPRDATGGTAEVNIAVEYVDAKGASKELQVPAFKNSFKWK